MLQRINILRFRFRAGKDRTFYISSHFIGIAILKLFGLGQFRYGSMCRGGTSPRLLFSFTPSDFLRLIGPVPGPLTTPLDSSPAVKTMLDSNDAKIAVKVSGCIHMNVSMKSAYRT